MSELIDKINICSLELRRLSMIELRLFMESSRETLENLGILTRDTEAEIIENLKKAGTAVVEIEGRKFTACLNQAGQIVVKFKPREFLLPETVRKTLKRENPQALRNDFNTAFLRIAAAVTNTSVSPVFPEKPDYEISLDIKQLGYSIINLLRRLKSLTLCVKANSLELSITDPVIMKPSSKDSLIKIFEEYLKAINVRRSLTRDSVGHADRSIEITIECIAEWRFIYDFFMTYAVKLGCDFPNFRMFRLKPSQRRPFLIKYRYWNDTDTIKMRNFSISTSLTVMI